MDAIGTNDPAGGAVTVHKNTGATVRKAFLFAASTGFSGYTPVDGDVTLNGTGVLWNGAHTIANGIASVNVEADVTSIVKPLVDAALPGDITITAAEPNDTYSIDGEILAVVLDDPTVTHSGSVILMYGAQNPGGDEFHVALADPIDKTNATFGLDLSVGISFSHQPAGQYSTIEVNGTLVTSSAGGEDDGAADNGALITAGGIGDSNDDPPDPSATDATCLNANGDPAPRCDDELYSLLPFVSNGDTALTFTTTNPSSDDNIFFGALNVRGGAAVVGEGVVLSPTSSTNNTGQPHTLTATVQNNAGDPVSGASVHFEVTSGPNVGVSGNALTDSSGEAQFTYTSASAGTDHLVASFVDQATTYTSNEVTKMWVAVGLVPTTTTYTGAATVQYSDPVGLSGHLVVTAGSVPIPGKTLGFTLGTQSTTAGPTDATGNASTSLVVTQAPGSVSTVQTSFAGDSTYAASNDSDPFSITKENCTLTYTGDTLVGFGNLTTLSAQFGEPDAYPGDWSNKTITFTATDSSSVAHVFSGFTSSSGAVSLQAALPPDVYGVNVSFVGDSYYLPCASASDTLVTVQAAGAKITGGGFVTQSVGHTSFGFNAISDTGGLHGQFQLRTRAGKNRFHGNTVLTLSTVGNTGTWTGTGRWNGVAGYTFTVSVVDNGSGGKKSGDTISIVIKLGATTVFTTGGPIPLQGGNITVH